MSCLVSLVFDDSDIEKGSSIKLKKNNMLVWDLFPLFVWNGNKFLKLS